MENSPPEFLSKIDIFSDLSPEERLSIDRLVKWKKYQKDKVILSHHEQSDDVYLIGSGSVKATTFSHSGKEIFYQTLYEGKMFGELSAIDNGERTASIICATDSVIGTIESGAFQQILESYPGLTLVVMKRLTGLIRFLCGRVYEYGALDVKDRVRAEIIRYARKNCMKGGRAEVTNMPTHEEIANKIITHREAVTKEFSKLAKQGLIRKEGRKLIVPDIQRLSSLIFEEI